jgi:hypothetical protein
MSKPVKTNRHRIGSRIISASFLDSEFELFNSYPGFTGKQKEQWSIDDVTKSV